MNSSSTDPDHHISPNHMKILIEKPLLLEGSKLEVHHKILGMLMQIETTQDDNQDYERRCLN